MKGDKSKRSVRKAARGQESESAAARTGNSDDSDCEILEPHISVIDLNDSLEESEAAMMEPNNDSTEIVEGCDESEAGIPNEIDGIMLDNIDQINNDADSSNGNDSDSRAAHDLLFTIAFNDRDKFDCLRDFVKDAIKKCLEERSVLVDMVEDDQALSVKVVEKLGPDTMTDLIFSVDTTPANKLEIGAIPSYRRSIREVYNDEKKKEVDEDECPSFKRASMCFNCSGTHSLKDCPEPKNQQRISRARKAMQSTKTGERYHVDIEQRYAHIRPGRISDSLRRALGLKQNEIPPFIYRMRVLGYPPGWLEDAKVSHSGLALFDSEGRQVQDPEEEDGEVNESKHKYDVRKILSFPGFNCEPEPGTLEDFRMTPMQPEDQKNEFIKSLGDNIVKGYKRKKLTNLNASDAEKLDAPNTEDMEIEDDVPMPQVPIITGPLPPPPLPAEYETPPPPPPPPEETPPEPPEKPSIDRLSRKRKRSPTLEDLEMKQRALLEALKCSTTALDATTDDSLIDEILEVQNMNESAESIETPLTANGDMQMTKSTDASTADTPQTPAPANEENMQNKTCLVLGTPVLKFSPYDSLPEGEKFSRGVSDVINFENLPDSTGKYLKMVKVIEKVRKAVLRSNQDS